MASKIKITFLGTSGAVPTAKRNHSAILLQYEGENILFDCGEGTQRQFRKARLNPCKVSKILISHWHGDHVLGIPGLLWTLALNGYNKSLEIFGPKKTKTFMKNLFSTFVFSEKIKLDVKEVSGKFFENKDFYLEAGKLFHNIPCNSYAFVKKGQIRIDKNKLEKLKIPSGKHLQNLKQGKDIVYKGKKYKAKDLIFQEGSKKICVVMDTGFNEKIVDFVKGADVLICESTFSNYLENEAKEYKHMTASSAAMLAKKAKVKKLILTHISQRYEKDDSLLLKEAKKIFRNSYLAKDLDVLEI